MDAHKDNEQSELEEEVTKTVNMIEIVANETNKEIDEDKDAIVSLITKGGRMAEKLFETLDAFTEETFQQIYYNSKKVHDKYISKLPNGGRDVSDEFHTIFTTVANKLFGEQGLTEQIRYKFKSDIFPHEWSSSKELTGDIKDPKTWLRKVGGEYRTNYTYTESNNDLRWIDVKWNYGYILDECKKVYGTVEDMRDSANDKWFEDFFYHNTKLFYNFCGWGDNDRYKKAPDEDTPNLVEEVLRQTIKS